MTFITQPKKEIPIIYEADVCVLGGSCTGLFAAIRAARLGTKVVVIEKNNCLGGTATAGLVNIWHSLFDTDYKEQIIAGLTDEVEQRLLKENALTFENNASVGCRFNPARLACLLDEMANENNIKLFLHTYYSDVIIDNDRISAIIVNNKNGVGAIQAKFFIDASGDGDIARDIGLESYKYDYLQPPTSCFYIQGNTDDCNISLVIADHGKEFGLDDDWGWYGTVPNLKNISFRADNHIFDVDCSNADDLTKAEIEGRRKAKAFTDMFKKYCNSDIELVSLCSNIGIRDTLHYKTRFKANEIELLTKNNYDDVILKGTYRIDMHHQNDNGITFKYLDGTYVTLFGKDERTEKGNWRDELGINSEVLKYYSVPFDILVQEKFSNFIPVGRMLNADSAAFGALRVMVNLNQLGEAAGVAAYMCIDANKSVQELNGISVKNNLNKGGSTL